MLRSTKSIFLAIVTLIVGFSSQSIFAQEQTGPVLTLQECVNIALEKNTTLRTSELADKTADMNVLSSYSNILPSLSATAGQVRYITGPSERVEPIQQIDSSGQITFGLGTVTYALQARSQSSAGLSLNQNIFDGGIWWNQIRKAKADKKASKYNFLSQRDNVILQTQQAYFNLISQIKLLEVYDLAVQRSQAQLDRTEKMYELGATARLDVYRAKVNLGNDRINYLNQKNMVGQSRKNLNLVMGRDPFIQLHVEADIQLAPALPVVEDMIETAYEQQPMLMKNEMDLRSSKLSVSLANGIYFPRLSAYVNYNRFHENLAEVFSNYDQNYQTRYGINLSFNLFNGFSDYASVQRAKISHKVAAEGFEEYKRNLKSAIHQYYEDYQSTLDIIKINEQNLEAAKEEVRLAEERYQIGAGTSLEVRESQVNLTRAEETLIAAQFAARITMAQLDKELGLSFKKLSE